MHDDIPKARGARPVGGGGGRRPPHGLQQFHDEIAEINRAFGEIDRMLVQAYNQPVAPRPRRRTDYRYLVVLFAGFMAWILMARDGWPDSFFNAGFATVVSLFGIWLSSRVNWR